MFPPSTYVQLFNLSDGGNSTKKMLVTSAGVILVGGGVLLAAPVAALGALNRAGFSAVGPVGGERLPSLRSVYHVGTYNVRA